ncbi:C1 family peptidase [Chloroflexota bacterium]
MTSNTEHLKRSGRSNGWHFKRVLLLAAAVAISLLIAMPIGAEEPPAGELQMAPLNPDFLDYLQNPPAQSFGYIPPPFDMSHLQDIPVETGIPSPLSYDPSFDWRTSGDVSAVKDQDPCGTCWIFGTMASLESKIMIGVENTEYDFSEQNVACCTDPAWIRFDSNRCNGGGWSWIAADTLAKKGTRMEYCDEYDGVNINTDDCKDECVTTKYVTGYCRIATTTDAIKGALSNSNYGPVAAAFCWNPAYYDDVTYIYNYPGCIESPNHLICIVGWNDAIGPSGAWIVKNSWGTGWGDSGFFYLCYDSGNMSAGEASCFTGYRDYNPSDTLYWLDETYATGAAGALDNPTAWMANVFTIDPGGGGSLSRVDFWTTSNSATYTIYVYQDSNPADGLPAALATQSGSCDEAGFYSIPLDPPVLVSSEQTYTIAVRVTTPDYDKPIPIEAYSSVLGCDPTIQTSRSYISLDGSSWTDIGTTYDWNAVLRGWVTEGAVSVSVTPETVEYGVVAMGESHSLSQQLTVTNNGGVTEDFTITSSDALRDGGTTWTLVTGTPGTDQFKQEFSTNSGGSWTALTTGYQTLATGVTPGSYVTVDLRITMPISTADPLEHNIIITIQASE